MIAGRLPVTIDLLYGRSTLPVTPPAGCVPTVIEKRAMPVLAEPRAAVERALAEPVGGPSLREAARGKRSACILICDITRPVPNGLFLPSLIRTLLDAGVPRAGITVLVATGLHRPNEGPELAELVGDPWVLETVTVANHDARADEDHVLLGRTPTRGTVVRLDRRLVEAELRIATGLVEPHFMAGWSGGRKVIAPGVAHAETITTFHNAAFMAHPRAANCVLDGNPLHEEQLAIMAMLGGALALNTVIDDRRRLAFVNFGEVVQSHLRAVDFAAGVRAGAGRPPVPDRGHQRGRLPARQDVLPDREGHGGPARHPGAGRRSHRRLRVLGRAWGRSIMSRRSGGWWTWARTGSRRASRASRTPTSTSGRPRCSSSPCGSAACGSTRTGWRPTTRR